MPRSGPFEILEVLGEGAFGAVCVAQRVGDPLKRRVAIKVLKQEYASNPKVLHRTRDEARLLAKLDHPNVVRVEQLVDVAGRPVVVMELVQGLDLKTVLNRHPSGLPVAVALEVIRQTCVALHAAYEEACDDDGRPLRVIHRDIKPSNMLLDLQGRVKVVDFGIATGQFQDRESQTESLVMGSRPYMAPERLDGRADTPAVDVYSAGMSLYELAAGRIMNLSVNPQSHGRALGEWIERLPLEGLDPSVAGDIREIIRRMCAYDVDYRPSARDVVVELGHILERLPEDRRVTLEDFAREVVSPLYARRDAIQGTPAFEELEDGRFLDRVFGKADPRSPSLDLARRPAIFVGAIGGLVVGLGLLALNKAMAPAEAARPTDLARVRFWIPSDASARVGTASLMVPGQLEIPPGPQEVELAFDDGRHLVCAFEAQDGQAVRYVVERGEGAVSVDDGPAVACRVDE